MDAPAPSPLRNLSLTAGKTEPDLPNRSSRPRLRSIRWVRPFTDEAEVYPLGPGRTTAKPVVPTIPALLGIHCMDRASLDVALGPRGIYKEPYVVLSFVNDRAQQYLTSWTGDYFAYVLVTSHNEMAIVSFDLRAGTHRPIVTVEDGAIQSAGTVEAEYAPAPLNLSDQAQQVAETAASDYPPAPLSAGDLAQQNTALSGSNYTPAPLLVGDRAALMQALLSGESRPIVTIDESAAQMMTQEGGEHFLSVQIQTLLEQAAENLTLGTGNHGSVDVTVTVGDQGALGVMTTTGVYLNMFPLDTMESYTSGDFLNSLNGGRTWPSGYVARTNFIGIQASDTMASYADSAALNALNGGDWTQTGPYVARDNMAVPGVDSMETYVDGENVQGLNGGTGFSGAYMAGENWIQVIASDTFDSYTIEDPLTATLSGGTGWSAAWAFPAVILPNFTAQDTFDSYAVEDPLTATLSGGTGWSGSWTFPATV